MSTAAKLLSPFLAERTNGRAYATVLRLSVVVSSVCVCDVCIVAKRCVLEQKLLLTAYTGSRIGIDSITGTKMNDLDLCLEVESRSCQPLRCIQRSLSRKPLEIEAWF